MPVAYSASKLDLYYPARSANFFPSGLPATEAGLCAEMIRLAYCRKEPYFQFDQDQIGSILARLGFSCEFFESAGTPEGRGTHGFLAVHEDANPAARLAVMAFRGTDADDPTDIGDDADFLQKAWPQGGRVHGGFADALDYVLDDITAALGKVDGRVLFTGHSLGAALATLLASVRRPACLYTFGSPRVGDGDFVATLAGVENRRFVDCCDIVARIPPEIVLNEQFAHFGVPYYIDRARQIQENPEQRAIDEDCFIASAEYVDQFAWRIGDVPVRQLADHAPINYVSAVMADVSQTKLTGWEI
jgi:pimeloyl-ACP methyl ester carboxylesterase